MAQRRVAGFTLAEVLISVGIATLSFGGIIYGYTMSCQRAEWSAYSLAAQSLAMQRVEQTRAAKWDPLGYPPVTAELSNAKYPTAVEILDIPISGTNIVYATNYTVITDIPGPQPLKLIRVDCVWRFMDRGVFTNTMVTYRAPDQ